VLVAVQIFDGMSASVFAVVVRLIVADVAFGTGHFNLAQGIVGTSMLASYISDRFRCCICLPRNLATSA
jgi:hypothetical protein